ncbi:DUF4190 domain-containing protein [Amycolatopsis sp. H20-H5]|uniref:DUF4190 domain-containing protein n=1 Tax=Amycolatopsis sp. H20-H5 TaxID=3046309 RepID=UPI002DBA830A|nr:DUF4190 domain-containing protein [Amycolatopsis sp. H20-H5]MEC3977627.1 DUF4190 domain-containing protein [Amycolatopsis sp. H20-H5]
MSTAPPFPAAPEQPVAPPKNGLGTAGFVLGLIGLLISFIPVIGVVGYPLVIIGLILSIVGLLRVNKRVANNKGLAIAGIVLSALGLIACILNTVLIGAVVNVVSDQSVSFPAKSGDAHSVEYVVTSAGAASVTYTGGLTIKTANVQAGASFDEKGSFASDQATLSLIVTGADLESKASCKIVVDGKTVVEKADTTMASCTFDFKG